MALSALLPDMRGYSAAEAALFLSNAAESPVVHLILRGDTNGLSAADRTGRGFICPMSQTAKARRRPLA